MWLNRTIEGEISVCFKISMSPSLLYVYLTSRRNCYYGSLALHNNGLHESNEVNTRPVFILLELVLDSVYRDTNV